MNIRVLREAGGIGDIVRIIPAIQGLRETYPRARIDVFIPEHYAPLIERAGVANRIVKTPWNRRPRLAAPDNSKWPYLRTDTKYDMTVDLYCPAFAHEVNHPHGVWNNRAELFCMAANVWPENLRPHIPISVQEVDAARAMLAKRGIAERRGYVAIQPFSTDPARDWPPDKWIALADGLAIEGYGVFALDSQKGRTRAFPVPQVVGLPLLQLAALLKAVKLLICPDSGLAHLSGAVGGHTVALTASQSGGVLYRHYPKHIYLSPPESAIPKGCQWPCYWRRPRHCQRKELIKTKRTCAFLATLEVAEVYDAAIKMICGNGRTGTPPWMPPQGPMPARSVVADIPPRTRVLDVGGELAQQAASQRIRHGLRTEALHVIPIPAFDRTEHVAALFSIPQRTTLRDWLWELFRVLKVGGTLYALSSYDDRIRRSGFRPVHKHIGWTVYEKAATWPKQFSN